MSHSGKPDDMKHSDPEQPGHPQPGPPAGSQSGRAAADSDRDAGVEAWDRHAAPDQPRDTGPPTTEWTDEDVDPQEQDDPSDSG
jgi:hypothetical protein